MKNEEILKVVDHTLLSPFADGNSIKNLCKEAVSAKVFSVCVPPSYVSLSKEILSGSSVKVCTVIGFPNGYSTFSTKLFETSDALKNGADEIDMVINIGFIKNKDHENALKEISLIKKICGEKMLKVIIETCYLTLEEKIIMCKIVTDSGADYIKTSTGFGTKGATFDDVKLIKKNIGENVKIKVAGGVSSFDEALKYINLGASRIGSSRLAKLALKS